MADDDLDTERQRFARDLERGPTSADRDTEPTRER